MSTAEFVSQYQRDRDREAIAICRRHDSPDRDFNERTRVEVEAFICLNTEIDCSVELIEDLVAIEGEWCVFSGAAGDWFPKLLSILIAQQGEKALPLFASSISSSFDAFGAAHFATIPVEVAARLLDSAQRYATLAASRDDKACWGNAISALASHAAGDPTKGWLGVSG